MQSVTESDAFFLIVFLIHIYWEIEINYVETGGKGFEFAFQFVDY